MSKTGGILVFALAQAGSASDCPAISEIQAFPQAGRSEWIELSEMTGTVLALRGWSLGDGTSQGTLDSSAILPAHGQLVLAYDCTRLRDQFGSGSIPCAQTGSWMPLAIETDRVVLRDPAGATCDSVEWNRKNWGDWPSGRSLERIDLSRSGSDPANWVASSSASGGTPGWRTNSVLEPIGSGISIEMLSRRAAPGRSSARVRLHAPWNARLDAGLYDLSRRKVALVHDGQIPASGEIAFDGAVGGGALRPGVYLLLLEFGGAGKDVAARFREWVVVEK